MTTEVQITDELLGEIERKASAATNGPWKYNLMDIAGCGHYLAVFEPIGLMGIDGPELEDGEHISRMDPPTTLALIAYIRRLRSDLYAANKASGFYDYSNLLKVVADIRLATGTGARAMLSELAGEIKNIVDERDALRSEIGAKRESWAKSLAEAREQAFEEASKIAGDYFSLSAPLFEWPGRIAKLIMGKADGKS